MMNNTLIDQFDITSATGSKHAIRTVGESLGVNFQAVLDAHPLSAISASEAARRCKVSQTVMSRVVRGTGAEDPLLRVYLMPGPESLRRLLRSARKIGVDSSIIDRAARSVDEFDRLINIIAEDRSGLDAIVSGWLPEVREKTELGCRQTAFRSMSIVKGASRDATINAFFIDPTSDGQVRTIAVDISIGLRRMRPGARVIDGAGGEFADLISITGEPVKSIDQLYFSKFCPAVVPMVDINPGNPEQTLFTLDSDSLGLQSAIDLAWGSQYINAQFPVGHELGAAVSIPSKNWHVFVFVHKDVVHRDPPEYRLYDTTIYGLLRRDVPNREYTALGPLEDMQLLGRGKTNMKCHSMPRFGELIQHVCDSAGSNVSDYKCFCFEQKYPIHGIGASIAIGPKE